MTRSTTTGTGYSETERRASDTIHPPLHAIVHQLRDAVRAQRDHLDDMLVIFCRLETALFRLATEGTPALRHTPTCTCFHEPGVHLCQRCGGTWQGSHSCGVGGGESWSHAQSITYGEAASFDAGADATVHSKKL